ncbi:MAG: hypothetical protein GY781_02065 [Gammaproteobacteria bacterium]|nr:hypothetical protein [Gammaproteobacteria bacterium]
MKKILSPLVILLLSSIVGCGGSGGGGGGSQPPVNRAPTATAPADFSNIEEMQVTLDGSSSQDPDGSIASYAWAQTAGTPSVTLTNASTAMATFTSPAVNSDTPLTFQLTVTDNQGLTATDSVVVTITPDQPPVAVAPGDFEAVETTTVSLDGTGSSDDLAITSYLWEQTGGTSVSLNSATSATASFTAPDVATGSTLDLTFSLTVTDSAGATHSDSLIVTIIDTPATVTLSGKITFDLITHTVSDGLDYNNISQSAVRGATVELLDDTATSILQTVISDSNGDYSFDVATSTSYVVRVKAELKKTGSAPTWDYTVVDNTQSQAIYAMDSSVQAIVMSPVVLNLNAGSGWTGTSYTESRVAAPFAILNSVYQAKEKIISVDATVAMPALMLNWSINNVAAPGDKTLGEIGTSHFDGTEIYILGDADSDTDEYDGHVIIHEWGHYFEGRFSRSDSIGGNHSGGDKLDMRVAVGEGFGNAFSGIVTDDSFYRDSYGANQSMGFHINVEVNPSTNMGWYSESSVQSLLYDIYDSSNDGADSLSLGFEPIYLALINGEKNTEALTSIFSLANQIKVESPANASSIDTLMASQDIVVNDDYGTGETNDGGDARNLPVYTPLTVGGGAVTVCSYDTNGQYNKLGVWKFLRFTIATSGSYLITVTGGVGGDPDIYLYKAGVAAGKGDVAGDESFTVTLSAGNYVAVVSEYANVDGSGSDTCLDVTISVN